MDPEDVLVPECDWKPSLYVYSGYTYHSHQHHMITTEELNWAQPITGSRDHSLSQIPKMLTLCQ
jgi:hypothetical protein